LPAASTLEAPAAAKGEDWQHLPGTKADNPRIVTEAFRHFGSHFTTSEESFLTSPEVFFLLIVLLLVIGAVLYALKHRYDLMQEKALRSKRQASARTSAQAVEPLAEIFAECDRNGDGQVSKFELIRALRESPRIADILRQRGGQEAQGPGAAARVFQIMDVDQDRNVSWAEFLNYFSAALEAAGAADKDAPKEPQDEEEDILLVELPLKVDTYNGVTACAPLSNERSDRPLFLTAVLLHILNMFVQLSLTAMLYVYTVERREDPYEGKDSQLADIVRAALALERPLNNSIPEEREALTVCKMTHIVTLSIIIITLTWWLRMLGEIIESLWTMLVIIFMPSHSKPSTTKEHHTHKKHQVIHNLNDMTKVGLIGCIYTPKLVIAVIYAWVGTKYLVYAMTMGELILKSVSIAFIVSLDENIFAALASERLVEKTNTCHLSSKVWSHAAARRSWMAGGSTLVKLTLVTALVFCVTNESFGQLVDLREQCHMYKDKFVFPRCPHCGYHIFSWVFNA
jgi:hypothetical protein